MVILHSDRREMMDLYLDHGMKPGENGGFRLTCPPRKEAALFMGSHHYDPWPLFPDVSCPVLIVGGETSYVTNLEEAAAAFPRASHRLVKGAGHLLPMEKPGEITGMIKDFLGTQIDYEILNPNI